MRAYIECSAREFKRFFLISLFVAVCLVAMATAARAGGKLVFIFDASGSMWGQIDGTAKIEIARTALSDLMKTIPAGTDVGLVAYGHRRKGDCEDIEELVPLKPLDTNALVAAVQGIKPKGKTPMANSVQLVADKLKTMEEEASIILISDGKETCNADPCKLVETLKRAGIKFTLHVIGFDVGGETEAQLKCMAKAGGGEYFSAKNAGDFGKATKKALEKVNRNLVVSSFDANNQPLSAWVTIMDASGTTVDSDGGKNVGFSLAPGTYTLKVKPETMTEVITLENVAVVENETTKKKVVFAESKVQVNLKDGAGKPVAGYVRIVNMADGQNAEEGDNTGRTSTHVVSPGKYQVDMECSNTGTRIKSTPFTLAPGETRVVEGVCAAARIGVLVVDGSGAPIIGYIRIVDVPKDSYAEEKDSAKSMSFIEVLPGTYKVDIECPGEKRVRSEIFDIQGGGEVTAQVDCDSGNTVLTPPSGGGQSVKEQPEDVPLPQVADVQPGAGAQASGQTVGASPSEVDYSNVGAVDTGGGLDGDERPEQGPNPYAGMTPEQAQAQFGQDVGGIKAKPRHAFNKAEYRLGSDYVNDARNIMAKMFSDLEEMKAEAAGLSGEAAAQVSGRITKAEGNLESLAAKINSGASRETLQRIAYTRGQELMGIRINIDNAK